MLFNMLYLLTVLFHHVSFLFLIIDLYFLIPGVITQSFNPTTELAIPKRITIKEAEMETHLITAGTINK